MPEKDWSGAVASVEKFGKTVLSPSPVFDAKGWREANQATRELRERVQSAERKN
jgi:hypothetical protein